MRLKKFIDLDLQTGDAIILETQDGCDVFRFIDIAGYRINVTEFDDDSLRNISIGEILSVRHYVDGYEDSIFAFGDGMGYYGDYRRNNIKMLY